MPTCNGEGSWSVGSCKMRGRVVSCGNFSLPEPAMSRPTITYTGSGTDPLRSNPKTLASTPQKSPAGAGKPCGGTENLGGKFIVLAAKAAKMAKGGPNRIPEGVKTFSGVAK